MYAQANKVDLRLETEAVVLAAGMIGVFASIIALL